MSKTFSEKNLRKSTKKSMSVFPRLFFVLSRFQVLLSDGSSKALQKTFYNKIDQKIPNRFFLDLFLSCFWAFLGEGSLKPRAI
jgi:hypothetical protein